MTHQRNKITLAKSGEIAICWLEKLANEKTSDQLGKDLRSPIVHNPHLCIYLQNVLQVVVLTEIV